MKLKATSCCCPDNENRKYDVFEKKTLKKWMIRHRRIFLAQYSIPYIARSDARLKGGTSALIKVMLARTKQVMQLIIRWSSVKWIKNAPFFFVFNMIYSIIAFHTDESLTRRDKLVLLQSLYDVK